MKIEINDERDSLPTLLGIILVGAIILLFTGMIAKCEGDDRELKRQIEAVKSK